MIIPIFIIFSYFGSQVFAIPGYIGFTAYLLLIILASYGRFRLGTENRSAYWFMQICKLFGLILALLGIYYIIHSIHHCAVINRQCIFHIL
ncbi:hypothetical protein PsalN5692_00129 [Piscirickettsia salmonis]|uniref:hypothetical protein n=1 Tax=Piscirickettsia salmonis TaxID=1238 RepID=UPI0012B9B6A0|nr:hypothetical protein [Piscirickettsia salmonis]QGP48726.1 hypothetical protein PsalN5692_00129 [Piscirickettsia salmonis]